MRDYTAHQVMEIRYPPITLIPILKVLPVKTDLRRKRALSSIISHPPGNVLFILVIFDC